MNNKVVKLNELKIHYIPMKKEQWHKYSSKVLNCFKRNQKVFKIRITTEAIDH